MATRPLDFTENGYHFKENGRLGMYVQSPEGEKLRLFPDTSGKGRFSQGFCKTFKGENTKLITISVDSIFKGDNKDYAPGPIPTPTGSIRPFFTATLTKFAKVHQIKTLAQPYGDFKEKQCEKQPGIDVIDELEKVRKTLEKESSQAIFGKVALMAGTMGEDYSEASLESIDKIFKLDGMGVLNPETQLNEIASKMLLSKISTVETAIINKKAVKGANVNSDLIPEIFKSHVETLNEFITKYKKKDSMNFPEAFERLKEGVKTTAEAGKVAQFKPADSSVTTVPTARAPIPTAKSTPNNPAAAALAQQFQARTRPAPALPPRPSPSSNS